ncbi:MAG: hypothetical protein ACE5JQ_13770 [Candidatus Methylomirabilales bacterium]
MGRGTKRRGLFLGLSALIWAGVGSVPLLAYDVDTHKEIGLRAVNVSSMDSVLKSELALRDGKASVFNERTAEDWLSEGAGLEDVPFLRVVNHFHNPLRPWDLAGLPLLVGQASVRWQQDGSQAWSWQFARQHYKEALTSAQPQQREDAFASTFRALGQLTHLVQDATVPAHVRNDLHPPVVDPDPYEASVEKIREEAPALFQSFLNSLPVAPPDSIFTPTGDTLAPVAIARLIDSDMFDGNNAAPLTDPAIGIAEYTNGNFLSRGTIFRNFVLPRESNLGAEIFVPEATPSGQKFRRYFRKRGAGETGGEGEPVDHFVAEGLLYETILAEAGFPLSGSYRLIGLVHQDYAAKLLPRAVGYSAGLLNYFFRGTLDFTVSGTSLTITNTSSETMDGTFTLYADNSGDVRSQVTPPLTLTLAPNDPSAPIMFSPPSEVKAFILVFEGKLVNAQTGAVEEGAVVGKVQPSPGPVSFTTQIRGQVSGNFIIDKPAGTTNGDLLLIALVETTLGAPGSFVPPAGWTFLQLSGVQTSFALQVLYKVAGASEPAAYDWGNPNSGKRLLGILLRISGNDTTSPIDASAASSSDIFQTGTAVTPSVTTTQQCDRVVRFVYAGDDASDIIPPSNHTEHVQISSSGFTDMLEVASLAPCPTGATGTVNFAISPGPAL